MVELQAVGVCRRSPARREFYRFDAAGKIVEIRAYYACPPADPGRPYELGEFDYAGRGYPVADR